MKNLALLTLSLALHAFGQVAPPSLTDGTVSQATPSRTSTYPKSATCQAENGNSKLLLQLDNDAAALRLHPAAMALPHGATLTVYGVDENNQFTRLDGPFPQHRPAWRR